MVLTRIYQQLKGKEKGGLLLLAKQGLCACDMGRLREDFLLLNDYCLV